VAVGLAYWYCAAAGPNKGVTWEYLLMFRHNIQPTRWVKACRGTVRGY
jgi:hypothetical protein